MGTPSTPASSSGWKPPSIEHLHSLLPQYEISRLLGHGGMGAVYEGVQSNLDRKVAIKILPETLGEDEEGLNFTERFKLEAKSMANLDHPGIISIHDFGQTSEGQLYFVMEFIDGMDIHQYLKHHGGKLPEESAIAITAHVLDALEFAHKRGIIHRDIKPANIMIKADGRVKVADFGLVKRLSESGEGSPDSAALTMTNIAIGTPDFVAPESLEIGRPVDHRADLYAVGVMFYQMLTGAVPRGNFKLPSGKIPALDSRLDTIVMRAMEADPDDRYASAAEFRAAIDEILSSPVPEDQHTGPVTPGGHRLHMTTVKKKTLAEPEETASPPTPARSDSQSPRSRRAAAAAQKNKKLGPLALAAIIGLPVVAIGAGIIALVLWFGGKDEPVIAQSSDPPPQAEKPRPQSTDPKPEPEPKPKPKEVAKANPAPAEGTPEPPVPEKKVASPVPEKTKSEAPPTPPSPTPSNSPEPTPAPRPPKVENDPVAKRLTDIDTKYRADFEKPYQGALKKLNDQFIGALRREEEAATDTGNLDLVLAFQNEAKRIANGEGAGAADDADGPPKLKQLRQTWHAQAAALERTRGENQKLSHEKRDQSLQLFQQDLVKAKNIAAAQRVKALREQLAANPDAGVATAIAGVPPEPVRSGPGTGGGNPALPVITMVPKLEFPPKRPTRVGELIRAHLGKNDEPEVVAANVVDFRVWKSSTPFAFVLSPSGDLKVVEENDSPASKKFGNVASKLSDVVSFDIAEHHWGVALSGAGKVMSWGLESHRLVSGTPSNSRKFSRVVAFYGWGAGLTESGTIAGWPESQEIAKWAATLRSVGDIRSTKPDNRAVVVALSERGRIEVYRLEAFEEDDQRTIEGVRNAVAIVTKGGLTSHPATLILLSNGEVVPVGWPRVSFPDGNPLPSNLPKDIENIFVGSKRGRDGGPQSFFGGVLSRSQGWIFFGKGVDLEKLEAISKGCFQIANHHDAFYGLRDPQAAAKPTPPVSVTPPPSPKPPTPRPAGNPLQPVITEVPKIEYPPKRPTRVGELIAFPLMDESVTVEVLGSDIVDFQPYVGRGFDHPFATLALIKDGRLAFTPSWGAPPIFQSFESVSSQLTDIVSFDVAWEAKWAAALKASGEIVAWGHGADEDLLNPPANHEVCQVFAKTGRGFALLTSGRILEWNSAGSETFLPDLEQVVQSSPPLALDSRGHLSVWSANFPKDYLEAIDKIRNVVRVAHNGSKSRPLSLVLTSDGEVIPTGWPENQFAGGNPLPPDLPKDIEELFLGDYIPRPGANNKVLGGVLSRSQGWIFFGEGGGVDFDRLAERARGCFQIDTRAANFYGLRDPVRATAPTPKPAQPAATTPLPKLPDPPEWLKKGRETGGKVRVWGMLDGEPIDEREVTKFMNTDDYVRINCGIASVNNKSVASFLGKRADGRGVRVRLLAGKGESDRFREIQAIDAKSDAFFADNQFYNGPQGPYVDTRYEVDDNSIVAGFPNNGFIYRDQSGVFRFDGDNYRANPGIYDSVAERITRDKARLVYKGPNSSVAWVTGDNRVRWSSLEAGKIDQGFTSLPSPEPLVDLRWRTNDFRALGASGTLYEGRKFDRPVVEQSPSRTFRNGQGVQALQRANGTWHATGTDEELNAFIKKIGRAIDLDVYQSHLKAGKHQKQIVVWIEPD